MRSIPAILAVLFLALPAIAAEPAPRAAVFPLGGDAREDLRERCAFALRAKLERTGSYDVIDGPKMAELAAESPEPLTSTTKAKTVQDLAALVDARVLIWGDISNSAGVPTLRLMLLDTRQKDPAPRPLSKPLRNATDVRFATEAVLELLPGVKPFDHPSETAVQHDTDAEALWKKNPNLLANGDFSRAGAWHAIYQSDAYAPPLANQPPAADKVVIQRLPEAGRTNNVLAMRLSRQCAENNGLACLSDPIRIEPDTRYRLSFRYRSDGPTLHVFVKGYTMAENVNGKSVEREIYRRQVPVTGATAGKWVTIVDELNPQHVALPVQTLRVDLYAYLSPGVVKFDDVILKAVGRPTRKAADEALDRPLSRPPSPGTPGTP